MEEQTIRKNLERFGVVFQKLAPAEQKELVGLFVDRIEVRRAVETGRRKNAVSEAITPSERLMEIRVKLHSAELAQGLEERAQRKQPSARRAHQVGQLDLRGRVDFTNAMRGEVVITAPFSQTLRLDARVRTVPAKAPEIEHPIVRAQKWHQMLENGTVPNRLALAKRVGVDPGMVTRVLRLVRLAPSIQAYLSSVSTASGAWHFNIRALGEIAIRPPERQERDFASLVAQYERRLQADGPTVKKRPFPPSQLVSTHVTHHAALRMRIS